MERLERELEQLQNKHGRPTSSDGEVRTSSSSPTSPSSRPRRRKPRRKRSEVKHDYVEEMFAFIGPIDTAIQKRKGSDDEEGPPRPPPPGDSESDSHSSGVVVAGYVEEYKFTIEDVLAGRVRLVTEDVSEEDFFGMKEGKWCDVKEGFDGSYERAKERHAEQIYELQIELEEKARLQALRTVSHGGRLIEEEISTDEDCFGMKEGKWCDLQEGFDPSYERARERHDEQIEELLEEIQEKARLAALRDISSESDEGSGVEMILSDGRKPFKLEDEFARKGDSKPRGGSDTDNTVTHEYVEEQSVEHEVIIDGILYPVSDDDDASFVSVDSEPSSVSIVRMLRLTFLY